MPEFEIARSHWDELRPYLANLDLDTYTGYDRVTTFAPKSRLNIRRVALLHPFDLLFYTALVLALGDDITAARFPTKGNPVFSYRSEKAAPEVLYNESLYTPISKHGLHKGGKPGRRLVGMGRS